VKHAIWIFGCALLAGCAAAAGAQDTASQTKGGLDSTKGMIDDTKGQVQAEKDKKAKADEEKRKLESGEADEDGSRLKAKEAPINQAIDDSVDFKKYDRNDWRKFQLEGKAGILTVELHWDDEKSNIDVDVYDTDGVNVGKSPPKLEGQQHKRVLVEVPQPGLYYVRISAPTDKDASIYTLRVKWGGKSKLSPPVVAQTPPATPPATPPGTPPPPPGTPPPPAAPVPFASDPTKVLGKIVTAYKEGSTWTLLLDQGSGKKIRAGMSGSVLDGPDGDKLLDGATFTITNVMASNKSEAHAGLSKPLGKNNRFVVNLQ
jgi:hypothetical protein